METHIFRITNMHCDDCAALIDDTLRALPGVHDAHATTTAREIHVELDPQRTDPDTVTAAITGLGFRMKPPPAARPAGPVAPQLSDSAWRRLEPLLRDRTRNRTRRDRDDREIFEGIAYKLRNGVQWRDVPADFGPWQTLYARFQRWRSDGTWARITTAARHDALAGELAWIESVGD